MNKAIIVSVAACLVGAPIVATVTSTPAIAQSNQSGVLTQAEAVQFANKLGMTLPDAIKAGYLAPAEVPGTYVITSAGAGAAGVPIADTLTPLQITALVAGALGLIFVTVDFLDDDDGSGVGPTPSPTGSPSPSPTATPSATPSPTPSATPSNPPTTTTTTTTTTSGTSTGGSGTR
ncbi:MAG: hypothetical protein ACPGJF_15175 [Sinimarinibacterium flocculans]|uniref:hypothetical protein n=1 Tax=Sinimarinibacterium flocculans TaxID=985250 RepID=UPI003C4CC20E